MKMTLVRATHIANPVRVTALRITEVDFSALRLEDGSTYHADAGMLARYKPVPGDYVVAQEDGYIYVNPKDVFERKYRMLPAASGLAPHQQRVVDEKAELDDRIQKLAAFIDTSTEGFSVFASLSEPERMRLYEQHRAMTAYSTIHGERIAAFGSQA